MFKFQFKEKERNRGVTGPTDTQIEAERKEIDQKRRLEKRR
jgi:hypothetical protein